MLDVENNLIVEIPATNFELFVHCKMLLAVCMCYRPIHSTGFHSGRVVANVRFVTFNLAELLLFYLVKSCAVMCITCLILQFIKSWHCLSLGDICCYFCHCTRFIIYVQ
jgi:hypothetical protein